MCALYKAYTGERTWKTTGDRLQAPSYLNRVDRHWKIRARKQKTHIGKYSFVNRSITHWNQLLERAIGTSHGKLIFSKRGLGKCKTVGEVKAIKSKKLRQGK
jgi:hypothetical protein